MNESRGSIVLFASLVLLTLLTQLTGCRTLPVGPEPTDAPSYATIAEFHNERVERLSRMHARGVLELRWRDEDGRHFEQGNLDLWLDLPRQTALRVEKLGRVFLWLGSDNERFWLFDMLGDETVLLSARHDAQLRGNGLLTVRPLVLLDLVGLTKLLDPLPGRVPPVGYSPEHDAWVLTAPGQGGVMRMYVDRASLLPVRVESLDDAGEVAYQSTMRVDLYQSVPRPGAPVAQFARMPRRTIITSVTPSHNGIESGEMSLTLDAPTGRVENQPMDVVFDLNRLMRSMRPDRIEGDLPTMSAR